MSNCNHNPKDKNTTLVFDKKWLGVFPRVYVAHCKLCKNVYRFIKVGDKYEIFNK
jgi:hypothetical protein